MNEDDFLQGYRDGRDDDRNEYPASSNRSASYRHGWLNGRDDRLGRARAPAAALRDEAEESRKADAWP